MAMNFTVINFFGCWWITVLVVINIPLSEQHGRLIEPPSRASAWRYGFSQLPANYNDHELFCGGFTRQHKINKGKCGECGDAFDLPTPRPHEFGGKYGQGITVRRYETGSKILIRVELTASHMGYFEFRLCDDINAKQACLDKNTLVINGSPSSPQPNDLRTRFYPRNGSRTYEIQAQLPKNLECKHCVLQWIYIAGNNWGICAHGEGAVGCGEQEEFRACSDVAIGKGAVGVMPSFEKWPPTVEETEIDQEAIENTDKPPTTTSVPNFFGAIIAMFTFFLVLCAISIFYLYFYHGNLLKQVIRRQQTPLKTFEENMSSTFETQNSSHQIFPVRPPRTKQISQTMKTGITAPINP